MSAFWRGEWQQRAHTSRTPCSKAAPQASDQELSILATTASSTPAQINHQYFSACCPGSGPRCNATPGVSSTSFSTLPWVESVTKSVALPDPPNAMLVVDAPAGPRST